MTTTHKVRFMADPTNSSKSGYVVSQAMWKEMGIDHEETVFSPADHYEVELPEEAARALIASHWPYFDLDLMTPLPHDGGPNLVPGVDIDFPENMPEELINKIKESQVQA